MQENKPTPHDGGDVCTLEHLSTDQFEPCVRFEAWRARAHQLVELEQPQPGRALEADLVMLRNGACRFGTMRSTDYATRADARQRPGCADMVVMTSILEGVVHIDDARNSRRRVGAGSLALYDLSQMARYEWIGPAREAYLILSRTEAMRAMGANVRGCGLPVPLDQCAIAPALHAQLALLARSALTLDATERAGLLDGAHALALLALHQAAHPVAANDAADDTLGSLSAGRYAAALHFMEQHAERPELDATAIARGIACSRSRLYAAFADRGETVMGALREVRLQRARAVLERGGWVHLGALAWHCGFADQSHFSRAFKSRFGATPSDWQRHARAVKLRSPTP
ncbi:MAG: AraC family transcriptional regulator [Burkholderiaceae bacterium]|nr:MAG: AraC family transcriptional regulator [Burkholderiaceae bacterium]